MAKQNVVVSTDAVVEVQQKSILQELRYGSGQALVVLIIPSHDKKNKAIDAQSKIADDGMQLLADLYGGATAFAARTGIFKSDQGQMLYDKPLLLESYAMRSDVEDQTKLGKLLGYLCRIGREMNQEAVGLVIDGTFHLISEFGKESNKTG